MKKSRLAVIPVMILAVGLLSIAGCSNTKSDSQSSTANDQVAQVLTKPPLEEKQVVWGNYTMGFEMVTDDQTKAKSVGVQYKGKSIKICFKYISDTNNSGGFVSKTFFDDLKATPITLKDASGNTIDNTGSIGDLIIKNSGNDNNLEGISMADIQPRLSLTFDVPADSKVEDFSLVIGNNPPIPLVAYISAAYQADLDKSN